MNCFYHSGADAVGTCKHCHRGVCRDCAAERDGGLACRDRCESAVDQVAALIARNIQVGLRSRSINLVAFFIILTAFGVLLFLAGHEENENVRTMLYIIAAISFVMVLSQASVIRTWFRRKSTR